MSLGRPCFYTYGPDDICHAHVRGESRPAVITGMNEDETVDLVVFTNGPRDGILQQSICKYDVPVKPGAVQGCAGVDEAEGSSAYGKARASDRMARVAAANALMMQQTAATLERLGVGDWEAGLWAGEPTVKTRVDPVLVADTPEPSPPAMPVAESDPTIESAPMPDETHHDTTDTEASPHDREPEGQGPLRTDDAHEPVAEPHMSSTEGSGSA